MSPPDAYVCCNCILLLSYVLLLPIGFSSSLYYFCLKVVCHNIWYIIMLLAKNFANSVLYRITSVVVWFSSIYDRLSCIQPRRSWRISSRETNSLVAPSPFCPPSSLTWLRRGPATDSLRFVLRTYYYCLGFYELWKLIKVIPTYVKVCLSFFNNMKMTDLFKPCTWLEVSCNLFLANTEIFIV